MAAPGNVSALWQVGAWGSRVLIGAYAAMRDPNQSLKWVEWAFVPLLVLACYQRNGAVGKGQRTLRASWLLGALACTALAALIVVRSVEDGDIDRVTFDSRIAARFAFAAFCTALVLVSMRQEYGASYVWVIMETCVGSYLWTTILVAIGTAGVLCANMLLYGQSLVDMGIGMWLAASCAVVGSAVVLRCRLPRRWMWYANGAIMGTVACAYELGIDQGVF